MERDHVDVMVGDSDNENDVPSQALDHNISTIRLAS